MEISFLQMALIRILYYMTLYSPPWPTRIVHVSIRQPFVSGTTVGLVLGDLQNGLIVGATINIIVLGFLNVEGVIPSNPGIAGVVGTSLAIATGAAPEVVVMIVASSGLVGTIVWSLRSAINSIFIHMVDSAAAQGNMKRIYFVQFVLAQIATFCISAVPVFGILYFGTDVATQVLGALKGTSMQILTVIGQILPAMGITTILRLLSDRPNIIQLFTLDFVLSVYGNMPMIAIAVVAFIIASLYADLKFNRAKEEVQSMERQITDTSVQTEKKLTKTDLNKCFLLWHLLGETTLGYERLQAPGVLGCLGPVLKRLCGDDRGEFVSACQRHMEFFGITRYYDGSIIIGLVCSLEEERANGLSIEGEDVSAVKTGLMGPLAGVFDALRQGMATPIVASIAIGMGMDDNFFGPAFYVIVIVLYAMIPYYWMLQASYKKEKEAINGLFASGKLEHFIALATAVRAITLGGLTAMTVTITSSTVLHLGNSDMALQETIFDTIFGGLLLAGFVFLSYFLLRKKLSTSKIILILITVAIVGVLIGLF